MNPLQNINGLSQEEAYQAFYSCCSSRTWALIMVGGLPFKAEAEMFTLASKAWDQCKLPDWMEAFSHHPRIGGNMDVLRAKYQSTGLNLNTQWPSQEQKGVMGASDAILQALAHENEQYEKKFGFVFLICATGKTASEMLDALSMRLPNTKEQEIENARNEQGKITVVRLKKLIEEMKTS